MSRLQDTRNAALFLVPAVAVTVLIAAPPLLYVLYTSLGGSTLSVSAYAELVSSALFRRTLSTTFVIALSACAISLVLGFAIALHLARQTVRRRTALMVLVLVPFWTSVLVKCFAFTVLLGRDGIVNSALSWVLNEKIQLPLLFNRVGALVGMVNYLTPFVVFPILASLLAIDRSVFQAAAIMGAKPARIFFTVTLPLAMPGLAAAFSSTFVISLGFFMVPALLGGAQERMLSNLINIYMKEALDWHKAAAIGGILLAIVLVILTPLAAMRRRAAAS